MSEHTVRTRVHQMIFVNLPVADTQRSREFYTSLGHGFNGRRAVLDALPGSRSR